MFAMLRGLGMTSYEALNTEGHVHMRNTNVLAVGL